MAAETQATEAPPRVQVSDRREQNVTVPNVERVVRDVVAERPVVREMSRAERVAAAAQTFTSSRETATKAVKDAAEKPAEAAGAKATETPKNSSEKPAETAGTNETPDAPEPDAKPKVEPKPKAEEKPNPRERANAELYAKMADVERRGNAKVEAVKAELAKERAEKAEAKRAADEFAALKAEAAKNPRAVLKATGLTFEQIARAVIAEKMEPVGTKAAEKPANSLTEEELEARVMAKLEAKMSADREEQSKKATAAERERVRGGVAENVRASEKYPALQMLGAEAEVFDYAMHVYEKGDAARGLKPGTRLELDKAAELMEAVARQEAERRFGPERVSAFIEAGKKPSTTQPDAKANGNGTSPKADAGKAGTRTTIEKRERNQRAQDGRFASKTPNGKGAASAAEDEDLSALSWEEQRAIQKQRATELYEAKMRK